MSAEEKLAEYKASLYRDVTAIREELIRLEARLEENLNKISRILAGEKVSGA